MYRSRDVFVGVLFTIGWFLFTYRGYALVDSIVGKAACVSALLVALFPSSGTATEYHIHVVASVILFSLLSFYTLGIFTKTSGMLTKQKIIRNRAYRTCGGVIIGSMLTVILFNIHPFLAELPIVLICETLALWAFGFSWFVKGETFWKDTV